MDAAASKLPYFVQESDEFKTALECMQSIESATETFKKTLKQKNKLKAEEEEDEDDAMINDVITSVLTENQSQTLNLQNETLSKKGKLVRGDVRGVFGTLTNHNRASLSGAIPPINPIMRNGGMDRKDVIASVPVFDGNMSIPKMRTPKEGNQANRNIPLKNSFKGLPRTNNLSLTPHSNGLAGSGIVNTGTSSHYHPSSYPPIGQSQTDSGDWRGGEECETRMEHLGRNDITLLKVFAETEIRTIFRENGNVKFNKMNTKRRSKDTGLFGVSLETLLSRDCKKIPSLRVPLFVVLLVSKLESHVDEEGILRVPGNQSRIKETVQSLESCDNPLPLLQSLLPHDLVGLLKHFFRSLPQPLFTLKWLDAFCKALSLPSEAIKLHSFQTLLCLLPDVHRATLQLLAELLVRMGNNDHNRMSIDNVSMMISPSLFTLPSQSSAPSSFSTEVEHLGQVNAVVLYMLRNHHIVWNVPALLLEQVRQVGSKTTARSKKYKKKTPENSFGMVFIHSLHPDHPQKCLKINKNCTVAEVLQAFNSFGNPRFCDSACLFENGGIIDQRLLGATERISTTLQRNPYARFSFSLQAPSSLVIHNLPEVYN